MKQHTIDRDNPPIKDMDTQYGVGTDSFVFIGEKIVTAYNIPDSDRDECLLLCESGLVICVSTDPGYKDDDCLVRDETRWEVVLYDATDTVAGRAIKKLERGQWL